MIDQAHSSRETRDVSASVLVQNMELRKFEQSKLTQLSVIIDIGSSYRFLFEALSRPVLTERGPKRSGLDLPVEVTNLIDQQVMCGKSPTMALLNYWSITGRRRPTIQDLLLYLRLSFLKRAEDHVQNVILGLPLLGRPTPAIPPRVLQALEYTHDESFRIDDQFRFENLDKVIQSIKTNCARYSFELIYKSTNKFCHRPFDQSTQLGTLMGEGRFSTVFRAQTRPITSEADPVKTVAAKLLKSECNLRYLANEVDLMQKMKHPNILELLGVSLGKQESDKSYHYMCFIYTFMDNGSLYDCLRSGVPTKQGQPIPWRNRVDILVKISRGITYLHTFSDKPVIHRDVKTANVLLDANMDPKLGDFTLVRQLDSNMTMGTQLTQNIIGTNVYMPPEAFRRDISVKFDTFSFGIVMFELLSGMRLYDEETDKDLCTFLGDKMAEIDELSYELNAPKSADEMRQDFLRDTLDSRAGDWHFELAYELFEIVLLAIEGNKAARPKMVDLMGPLERLGAKSRS